VAIAEGFTLGLDVGEGVFEATRGVSSAVGVATSVVGITVGEDVGLEMGEDAGVSIDRDSLWFGVQRESINTNKTTNAMARLNNNALVRLPLNRIPKG
jgi:hypothetical protein